MKKSAPLFVHRNITVEFTVFSNFTMVVEWVDDIEAAIKQHPSIAYMADTHSAADAVALYDGDMTCYIFYNPGVSPGTIAHEAWHAIYSMFKRVGVKITDEVVAYHLGYLVDRIAGAR